MKPAVVKSRTEAGIWMVVSRGGVDLFGSWSDALHWALVCSRAESATVLRQKLQSLLERIQ